VTVTQAASGRGRMPGLAGPDDSALSNMTLRVYCGTIILIIVYYFHDIMVVQKTNSRHLQEQ
jgi:hypothetical protein